MNNCDVKFKDIDSLKNQLAEMIKEILAKDTIAVNDNFYEIGGSSLLLIRLVANVYTKYEIEMDITLFLESLTIEKLADYIYGVKEGVKQ